MKRSWLVMVLAPLLLAGCASTVDVHRTENALHQGDYEKALQEVYSDAEHVEHRQGPIVRALDVGMVQHYAGDYEGSNASLSEAERRIAEAYTKSVTRSAASFVVNDNTKEYPGEDFEDIYSNIFMSLNYARQGKISDAMVEIRRSTEKQQVLKDLYAKYNQEHEGKIHFTHSALGSWLGMLFSRHLGDENDTRYYERQVTSAFEEEKDLFPFDQPSIGEAPAEGTTRVSLLAFTNIEPWKQEKKESIWMPSGNWMTIAVPVLKVRTSEVQTILAGVDGSAPIPLQKLEDISSIAENTYLLKKSGIYAKATIRATGKLVATDTIDVVSHTAARDSKDSSGGLFADLLTFAANLFGNLSERADVRMSHFLPGSAYIGSFDLPEGNHTLTFTYLDGKNSILKQETVPVEVKQGEFHLLESFCLR